MDVSTRRRYLAVAAVVAFAAATFLGGGYAFGLLTDQEETDVSVSAASDFGDDPSSGDVTFRGCGEVWLRPAEGESFSATFALYNASRDARETVALAANDAAVDANGFRYHTGRNRYEFAVRDHYGASHEEDKVLGVRFDGRYVENERPCAAIVEDEAESVEKRETTTTTAASPGTESATSNATGTETSGTGNATASEDDATETTNTTTTATTGTTASATTETTAAETETTTEASGDS